MKQQKSLGKIETRPGADDRTEVILLSPEAQEQFVSLLVNPPKPPEALLRALRRHRSLIVG